MSDSTTLSKDLNLREDFAAPDMDLWRELTEKVLNGAPIEKKLYTKTPEGITLKPLYIKEDLEGNDWADTTPGQYPYVRGTDASGYRNVPWEVAQSLVYPTAAEFNKALKEDLMRGQDSVVLVLDEAGRLGLDPSNGKGLTGLCGTSIADKDDIEVALDGIDLRAVSIHVNAGVSAPAIAAMLMDRAEKPCSGSIAFDPHSLMALNGTMPMSAEEAYSLSAKLATVMSEKAPGVRTVGVDVSWSTNAGGTAFHELALMLASMADYLRALEAKGISPDVAGKQAQVKMAIGSDFFMEIAKFRAAKGLWAQLLQACGAGADAQKIELHASTQTWNQTKHDPYVNMLRSTSEAFSAVVGGVNAMTVDPFDSLFGLPNEFSRRISRNIQLVLRDEAHMREVVDGAGGSWAVETLTRELGEKAWSLFQEIEAEGGFIAALKSGSLQQALKASAKDRKTKLAQRRSVMVGTNMYANLEEELPEPCYPDVKAVAAAQAAALSTRQAERDNAALSAALDALKADPSPESMLTAIRLGGTLGEIGDTLSGETGECVSPVKTGSLTDDYEKLRADVATYTEANGAPPVAFMAQMGPVRQHKIRSDFSQEFLKPSGFDIVADQAFEDAEAAAESAVAAQAAVTVICSTDDTYPELVPVFAKKVKELAPETVVIMAGLLPDLTECFKEAGVDEFIHIRANNLDLLQALHTKTGVAQ